MEGGHGGLLTYGKMKVVVIWRVKLMTPAQKRLQDLKSKQSHQRGRMAELSQEESLTTETRAELDEIEKGTPDLERQLRAAMVALESENAEQIETRAAEPDAEMRERMDLRSRASLTNFFVNGAGGRQATGAEAELMAAAGITKGVPLELFDTRERRQMETRVDVQTDAPSTVGVNLDRIRPAVFANAVLPMLGVEMPRVDSGTYATATINTNLTAGAYAQGGEAMATAAGFDVSTATPKRITGRLSIQIEDVAAVGQANFESALRENVSLVMSAELDRQGLNGDGQAPNLSGLFQGITPDPNAPTAIADFGSYASAHAGGVDGLWANSIMDVMILCGPATYRHAASTFQTTAGSAGEVSAAAYAAMRTGGFSTNARMPDAASNIQQAILYRRARSFLNMAEGYSRTAVCPQWGYLDIDDIYSGSAKGERFYTMHVLLGDVILVQPDAYAQISYRIG